jgi:four helix bundle protein
MTEMVCIAESKTFCEMLYRLTYKMPMSEQFGLTNQIRRAAVSVVSNLVEGNSYHDGNQAVLFDRAYGSIREVQVQLDLIKRLYGIEETEVTALADSIGAMIFKLLSAVRRQPSDS